MKERFNVTDWKKKLLTPAGIAVSVLMSVLLLFLCRYYKLFGRRATEGAGYWRYIFFAVLFLVIATWIRFFVSNRSDRETRALHWYEYPLYAVFFGVFWHFMLEIVVSKGVHVVPVRNHVLSVVLCAVAFLILLFISGSLRISGWIGSAFFLISSLGEFYTIEFRHIPVQFYDFSDLGTAADVALNYKYELNCRIISFAIVTILVFVNLAISRSRVVSRRLRVRLGTTAAGGALLLAFFFTILHTSMITSATGRIDGNIPLSTFRRKGVLLSFLQSMIESSVDAPEGYEDFRPDQFGDEYRTLSAEMEQEPEFMPDVICIMNETFADIDILGNLGLADEVMPVYQSLSENTMKGKTMVTTLGGGTGKSEYEFLTGNSMHLYSGSISPYMRLGTKLTDSLASQMKKIGYQTNAIHPYKATNYNREKTYAAMGFDRFYSIDDFPDMEKVRSFCSDPECYRKIYETTDSTDQPVFTFCVTIQNHSPYNKKKFESTIKLDGLDCPEAEQYLSLIRLSDEALTGLIDHYSQSEKPTMIVFFGDHFPSLPNEFWEYATGSVPSSWDFQRKQYIYSTPYFIWTNYPCEAYEDGHETEVLGSNELAVIALQMAGLPLTPYQEYLMDVRNTLPAFSGYSWYGDDHQYHSFDENEQTRSVIQQFDCVQYNELFDRKNRLENFFGLIGSEGQ